MRSPTFVVEAKKARNSQVCMVAGMFDFSKGEIISLAETLALLFGVALVLLVVVRPMLRALTGEDKDEEVQASAIRALGEIGNEQAERVLTRWLDERRTPVIQEALREALAEVELLTTAMADGRNIRPRFEGDRDDDDARTQRPNGRWRLSFVMHAMIALSCLGFSMFMFSLWTIFF